MWANSEGNIEIHDVVKLRSPKDLQGTKPISALLSENTIHSNTIH